MGVRGVLVCVLRANLWHIVSGFRLWACCRVDLHLCVAVHALVVVGLLQEAAVPVATASLCRLLRWDLPVLPFLRNVVNMCTLFVHDIYIRIYAPCLYMYTSIAML